MKWLNFPEFKWPVQDLTILRNVETSTYYKCILPEGSPEGGYLRKNVQRLRLGNPWLSYCQNKHCVAYKADSGPRAYRRRKGEGCRTVWGTVFGGLIHNFHPSRKPSVPEIFQHLTLHHCLQIAKLIRLWSKASKNQFFCLASDILWNNMSKPLSRLLRLAWKYQNF